MLENVTSLRRVDIYAARQLVYDGDYGGDQAQILAYFSDEEECNKYCKQHMKCSSEKAFLYLGNDNRYYNLNRAEEIFVNEELYKRTGVGKLTADEIRALGLSRYKR